MAHHVSSCSSLIVALIKVLVNEMLDTSGKKQEAPHFVKGVLRQFETCDTFCQSISCTFSFSFPGTQPRSSFLFIFQYQMIYLLNCLSGCVYLVCGHHRCFIESLWWGPVVLQSPAKIALERLTAAVNTGSGVGGDRGGRQEERGHKYVYIAHNTMASDITNKQ